MDRNVGDLLPCGGVLKSLSARRAWIEISASGRRGTGAEVALRKESVDRNLKASAPALLPAVALRKESVDRNLFVHTHIMYIAVALRKESVDRNQGPGFVSHRVGMSLSARRAWIEIQVRPIIVTSRPSRSPQGERG